MTGIAALSLREAFRAFTRQKSTFTVAVLTLALGLSVCTAIFCVLYSVILSPLSYGDPKRLVIAWAGYEGGSTERDTFSEQSIVEWRQRSRTFDGVAGFSFTTLTVLQRGEPLSVEGSYVSPDFFSVLTVRPVVGAAFSPEEARSTDGRVAMISDKLWRERFNADPNVAGQSINLSGKLYTVTGVLPAEFDVPTKKTAAWIPLRSPAKGPGRNKTLYVVARMRPSVDLGQAQADADVTAKQLAAEFPDTNRGMRIHLIPYVEELVKESRPLIAIASVAAFLTLLICCANVSNLLLVRAIVRRSEFATRLAIGAARRHLLAVVFNEGLLLAICGGILGAGLTYWTIEGLLQLSPVALPRSALIGRGFQIPIIAAGLIAVAALLASIPAAWEVSRSRLGLGVPLGTRTTSRRFARQLIVVLEVAVALTLLAGSGLMLRTVLALRDSNPGWKSDHVFVGVVALPSAKYREPHQIQQFFQRFIERLQAVPGQTSIGASSSVPATPIGADVDLPIQLPGQTTTSAGPGQAGLRIVSPGLFKTLGIPQLQGRDFDASDGAPGVRRVIVNQAFVKKYLPNAPSALGQPVVVFLNDPPETYDIIGVVGDLHHYGILQATKPEFYISYASYPFWGMGVVVRTTGNPYAFAPTFRKELAAIDPELPTASEDSMEDIVQATWNDRRVLSIVMAGFSALVVVLTIVGVFSVVGFSVSRQVREIAIHMAVGAHSRDVVRLVMSQSAWPVVAGVALGLLGAWMLGRGLAGQMYGVSATDPQMLLAATAGVVIVAGIAAYVPSRRAAKLNPVAALRTE